jgi:hypothetical protein
VSELFRVLLEAFPLQLILAVVGLVLVVAVVILAPVFKLEAKAWFLRRRGVGKKDLVAWAMSEAKRDRLNPWSRSSTPFGVATEALPESAERLARQLDEPASSNSRGPASPQRHGLTCPVADTLSCIANSEEPDSRLMGRRCCGAGT